MQNSKLEWEEAKDVKKDIQKILKVLRFPHIKSSRVFCFRTRGSKSRSYARIWAMPKIFQALFSPTDQEAGTWDLWLANYLKSIKILYDYYNKR